MVPGEAETVGNTRDALWLKARLLWTTNGYQVPVCWSTPGWPIDKARMQAAIQRTWDSETALNFSFVEGCPPAGATSYLKLKIVAKASTGGSCGFGMVEGGAQSCTIDLPPDGTADAARLDYVIIHEIGHALAFHHEQNRAENDGKRFCNNSATPDVPWAPITPYDDDSVMNYCAGNQTQLTRIDVEGARLLYGWPGAAKDVAIGSDGSRPWIVASNGQVQRWDGTSWMIQRTGSHLAVDVERDGTAWAVTATNTVVRMKNGVWSTISTSTPAGRAGARDIGAGASLGSVWKIDGGAGGVSRWDGVSTWVSMRTGAHLAVDVAPDGNAWVVDAANAIWRHDGSTWVQVPGSAVDVSIGTNGVPYVVNATTKKIDYWTAAGWREFERSGADHARVSIGPNEQVAATDAANHVTIQHRYGWPGMGWNRDIGTAMDVGIGSNGSAWSIATNRNVMQWQDVGWVTMRGGLHRSLDVDSLGNAWVVSTAGAVAQWTGTTWTPSSGITALEIGIGAAGKPWAVRSGGDVARLNGATWEVMRSGSHLAVDADLDGNAWVVTSANQIYHHTGVAWHQWPGEAIDVTCGSSGWPTFVNTGGEVFSYANTGFDTYASLPADTAPDPDAPRLAVSLDVGPSDQVWAVTDKQLIYRRDGGTWTLLPGGADDIGVGASGVVACIGSTSKDVFVWNTATSNWSPVRAGDFIAVDVGPTGDIWAVASNNDVWRRVGTTWSLFSAGAARDIAVGPDGTVWAVSASGQAVKWTGSSWQVLHTATTHTRVSVDNDGFGWVASNNGLKHWNGTRWIVEPGTALDIGVSPTGRAFITRSGDNTVFKWTGDTVRRWNAQPAEPLLRATEGVAHELVGVSTAGTVHWRTEYGVVNLKDVSVGDDIDRPWGVGAETGMVYHRKQNTWVLARSGQHLRVEAGPGDTAWAITSANDIHFYDGAAWTQQPSQAKDIGVGANGTAWIVGMDDDLYRWSGTTWQRLFTGTFVAVDVKPDGDAWAVEADGDYWQLSGTTWTQAMGLAQDVGVGFDGTTWILRNGNLYSMSGNTAVKDAGPYTGNLVRVTGAPGRRTAVVFSDRSVGIF